MEYITLTKVIHLAQDVQRETPKQFTMSSHRCHREKHRNEENQSNNKTTP